jgi:hypothetical protein
VRRKELRGIDRFHAVIEDVLATDSGGLISNLALPIQ